MKVVFSFQNNNVFKPQEQLAFGAGLTQKMMQEIRQINPLEVSRRFAQKGVPANFNGDKVIAWFCDKNARIVEQIRKLGYKWSLPVSIDAEEFSRLNVENPNALGTCNMLPTKLKKGSKEDVPPGAIFFNSAYDWGNVDKMADDCYSIGSSATPHCLGIGLHEFAHGYYKDQLLDKIGANALERAIDLFKVKKQVGEYQRKYGQRLSQICDYALTDPFETIACDIPRVVIDALDKDTLKLTRDPFKGTPYANLSFWQRVNIPNYPDSKRPLPEILRRLWNGKFE